jgi:hypothetical protein
MLQKMALSDNTKRALVHLKKLTATDGWSVELKLGEVRLLRRSIPLTDNFFLDLYVEPGERTVGILSSSGRSQVLVDASGRPVGGRVLQLITCPSYRKESARVPVVDAVRDHPYAMDDVLTDQENKKLLLFAAYAIGAAIAFRVVLQAFFYVYLLAFPLVFSMPSNRVHPTNPLMPNNNSNELCGAIIWPTTIPTSPRDSFILPLPRSQHLSPPNYLHLWGMMLPCTMWVGPSLSHELLFRQ